VLHQLCVALIFGPLLGTTFPWRYFFTIDRNSAIQAQRVEFPIHIGVQAVVLYAFLLTVWDADPHSCCAELADVECNCSGCLLSEPNSTSICACMRSPDTVASMP